MAINKCLQVYHVSHVLVQGGLEDLSLSGKPEVKRLDTMSRDPLATLQKGSEFPLSVQRADCSLRLYWCTEKPQHSMVHWASNYRTVCWCLTISTNVNEGRMKTAVKTKAKKSNNQTSFGGSGQHGGGGSETAGARPASGRNRCAKRLHRVGLPVLGLFERVRNIMQTLHTRNKVCKVCKCGARLSTFLLSYALLAGIH
jgi:hypothetical protein